MDLTLPLLVVLDFDGTITREDTIGTLADIAIAHQKSLGLEKQAEWNSILEAYTTDLTAHKATFPNQTPGSLERTASGSACLSSLKSIEYVSIARISSSQLFKDLNQEILLQGAKNAVSTGKVAVRDGYREFVEMVKGREGGGRMAVVSVNWSDEWIKAVLVAGGVFGSLADLDIPIASNRIDYKSGKILGPELEWKGAFPRETLYRGAKKGDEEIKVERQKRNLLTTADEKLKAVKILYSQYQHPTNPAIAPATTPLNPSTRTRPKLIYIGDSPTDLDILLIADIAIIMKSPSTGGLRQELEKLGWECRFIGEWKGEGDMGPWLEKRLKGKDGGMGREKVVFWAEDWRDVLGCGIFG